MGGGPAPAARPNRPAGPLTPAALAARLDGYGGRGIDGTSDAAAAAAAAACGRCCACNYTSLEFMINVALALENSTFDTAMHCMSTKYGVDSSCRFPFRMLTLIILPTHRLPLAINTKLSRHTVHGSGPACKDPEVKRSRSQGHQVCCWRGSARRCDSLHF